MVRSPETDESSGNKESNEDLLAQANPWQEAALENEAAESFREELLTEQSPPERPQETKKPGELRAFTAKEKQDLQEVFQLINERDKALWNWRGGNPELVRLRLQEFRAGGSSKQEAARYLATVIVNPETKKTMLQAENEIAALASKSEPVKALVELFNQRHDLLGQLNRTQLGFILPKLEAITAAKTSADRAAKMEALKSLINTERWFPPGSTDQVAGLALLEVQSSINDQVNRFLPPPEKAKEQPPKEDLIIIDPQKLAFSEALKLINERDALLVKAGDPLFYYLRIKELPTVQGDFKEATEYWLRELKNQTTGKDLLSMENELAKLAAKSEPVKELVDLFQQRNDLLPKPTAQTGLILVALQAVAQAKTDAERNAKMKELGKLIHTDKWFPPDSEEKGQVIDLQLIQIRINKLVSKFSK